MLPKQSEREIKLLDKLFKNSDDVNKRYYVAQYWPDPVGLPCLFDELGFKNIQVDAVSIPQVIDDTRNSKDEKVIMLEAEKAQFFEGIDMKVSLNKEELTDEEIAELKHLIAERFNQRFNLIKDGKHIWDYTIFLPQIVSGMVE